MIFFRNITIRDLVFRIITVRNYTFRDFLIRKIIFRIIKAPQFILSNLQRYEIICFILLISRK